LLKFGFVNPQDGEQVVIKVSREFYHFYWKDAIHVILLHGNDRCSGKPDFVTELDITKRIVTEYQTQNYPESIQDCYYYDHREWEPIQLNTTDQPGSIIEIIDPETGEWMRLPHSTNAISDLSWESSPNKDYLAVVQYKGVFDFPDLAQPIFGDQISVYSMNNRELIQTLDEGVDIQTRILFLDNENFVFMRENTPCVVTIGISSRKCVYKIQRKIPNATVIFGDRLATPWKITFIYFSRYPDTPHGGFCFYDFITGELDCPTDHFSIMDGQTVTDSSLSPDEKYLLFEYDEKGCPTPWCDFFRGPRVAVIDLEKDHLVELGSWDEIFILDTSDRSGTWRPIEK
jgi:hypothetical protein